MVGYNVSVGKELLPGLLSGQDGLAKLVEAALNQILAAQVTERVWGRIDTSARKIGRATGATIGRVPSSPVLG